MSPPTLPPSRIHKLGASPRQQQARRKSQAQPGPVETPAPRRSLRLQSNRLQVKDYPRSNRLRPTNPNPSTKLHKTDSHSQAQAPKSLGTKNQTNKRKRNEPLDTAEAKPFKRKRLTEKNLRSLEKMGGRDRKSAGSRSTGKKTGQSSSSSTTTTTGKDFGPRLKRNNIITSKLLVRAPDDEDDIRQFLDKTRESEPPSQGYYKEYLASMEGRQNEATTQGEAYPFLSKRIQGTARLAGYGQKFNYAWSEVDNHLTKGLSDAKPDIIEAYRKTEYPPSVQDDLSSSLAPTSYDIAMPAFAVEAKSLEGCMEVAQLQCAYDGALMTHSAYAMHNYMGRSDADFYGKTQAVTIGYDGENLKLYTHHAVQTSKDSPQQAVATSNKVTSDGGDPVEYHQHLLIRDNPCDSYEGFKAACKHTRNAQDLGYRWATERKDALSAYANAHNMAASKSLGPEKSSNDFLIRDPGRGSSRMARRTAGDTGDNQVDADGEYVVLSEDEASYVLVSPPRSSKNVGTSMGRSGRGRSHRARLRTVDTPEALKDAVIGSKGRKSQKNPTATRAILPFC
ncbi:hypothetical protein G7Y89_g11789 [Cudoniella acicularis]|uniref:DUF7924 domain-containing protein n=1 Tax=Cudoniella acicularis TaxID=354080 RepID=A0A8H4RA74_9HELO|nr:hypothetical protein G7Y89_g11789 [Cudoniella acicularis]